MAHIALVATEFHSQVQSLARALESQRHQVTILTGYDQKIPDDFQMPVLRPFKSWSAWEAAKMIPRMISQMPEIWHFVFTKPNERPLSAHWILSQFAHTIPHKIVVATFFSEPTRSQRWRLSPFLNCCDLVTTGERDSLLYLKREFKFRDSTILDIVPPIQSDLTKNPVSMDDDIEQFTNALGNFFYVPGSPEEFYKKHISLDFLKNAENPYKLVFNSKRKSSNPNYLAVGHLTDSQRLTLISKSKAILLAFHDLSLLELQQYFEWATSCHVPLIVRPHQNDIFPGLCRDHKTGWVLTKGEVSLDQLLTENPQLQINRHQMIGDRSSLTDTTLNELQRLYLKAYQNRWA